jgi:hypothetical protein
MREQGAIGEPGRPGSNNPEKRIAESGADFRGAYSPRWAGATMTGDELACAMRNKATSGCHFLSVSVDVHAMKTRSGMKGSWLSLLAWRSWQAM